MVVISGGARGLSIFQAPNYLQEEAGWAKHLSISALQSDERCEVRMTQSLFSLTRGLAFAGCFLHATRSSAGK